MMSYFHYRILAGGEFLSICIVLIANGILAFCSTTAQDRELFIKIHAPKLFSNPYKFVNCDSIFKRIAIKSIYFFIFEYIK